MIYRWVTVGTTSVSFLNLEIPPEFWQCQTGTETFEGRTANSRLNVVSKATAL